MAEPQGHAEVLARLKARGGGVAVGESSIPGQVRIYAVRNGVEFWEDMSPERAEAVGKALIGDAQRQRQPTLFDTGRPNFGRPIR